MTWYAVFDKANGRLASLGTVLADPLPKDLIAQELPGPPRDDQMWDEATRSFVPRPPKVLVDRLRDLLEHANYAGFREVWEKLNAAQQEKLRDALIRLLGRARWRNQTEAVTIEPEVP